MPIDYLTTMVVSNKKNNTNKPTSVQIRPSMIKVIQKIFFWFYSSIRLVCENLLIVIKGNSSKLQFYIGRGDRG